MFGDSGSSSSFSSSVSPPPRPTLLIFLILIITGQQRLFIQIIFNMTFYLGVGCFLILVVAIVSLPWFNLRSCIPVHDEFFCPCKFRNALKPSLHYLWI